MPKLLKTKKHGAIELRPQINLREWIAAFLFYVPTANANRVKGGARNVFKGGTSDEIYNALKLMKYGNRTN